MVSFVVALIIFVEVMAVVMVATVDRLVCVVRLLAMMAFMCSTFMVV